MRKCSNCFIVKPLSEFYRKLGGYQYRCKACNAENLKYQMDVALENVMRRLSMREEDAMDARAREIDQERAS